MKFKRLLSLVCLSVVLNGSCLWAMDDAFEEGLDEGAAATAAALTPVRLEDVETLFADGKAKFHAAITKHGTERYTKLIPAENEFEKAWKMVRGRLDLSAGSGELLSAQIYFYLGATHQEMGGCLTCECNNCIHERIRYMGLAGEDLLISSLLNGEDILDAKDRRADVREGIFKLVSGCAGDCALANHAKVVTEEIMDWDAFFAQCIDGTDSTHAGLQTRLDRFFAKHSEDLDAKAKSSSTYQSKKIDYDGLD